MKRYHIWTIGCQMNVADSIRIGSALEQTGYIYTEDVNEANVIVLNTCVVRQKAEDSAIGRLGSLMPLKRSNPDTVIAVTGCMVPRDDANRAALRKKLPAVDLFFDTLDPQALIEILPEQRAAEGIAPITTLRTITPLASVLNARAQRADDQAAAIEDALEHQFTLPAATTPAATIHSKIGVTAYVPVIYGCNYTCSYCIVPLRRGKEQSRPMDELVEEITAFTRRGVREVTLLGQTVDAYGHDLPGRPDLADLLERIDAIPDLARVRFLTSHPKMMSLKMIRAIARLPKVMEYLSLPIQAGDDAILKAMKRPYTVAHYEKLAETIRHEIPEVALSTDIIVGFPGETDKQFQNTCDMLERIRFSEVHVAAYSPRSGTLSARIMEDDVPREVKRERLHAVERLQEGIGAQQMSTMVGRDINILVERKEKGRWYGRSRQNKPVFFDPTQDADGREEDWNGKMATLRVTHAGPWSLVGSVHGHIAVPRDLYTIPVHAADDGAACEVDTSATLPPANAGRGRIIPLVGTK